MEINPGYIIKNRFENVTATNILVTVKAVNITTNTGQVSIFEGATLYEDKFTGGLDGVCIKVDAFGNTLEESAVTSGGSVISVISIDSSGNYQLSGTPANPSAIRYILLTTIEGLQNIPIAVRETLRFVEAGGGGGISYVYMNRPPEITDYLYDVGTRWIDTTNNDEYLLFVNAVNNAIWKKTTSVDENGNVIIEGELTINGGLNFGETIAYNLTDNANNLVIPNLENTVLVLISSEGSYIITGIAAPNPKKTKFIKFVNVGINNISFRNLDGGSIPENQFNMGSNKTMQPNESIEFSYDNINDYWRRTGDAI